VELLQEAEFWVGVAFVLFVGLMVWLKAPAMAIKQLDAKADKIRAELAEAERLRKEAEGLLAQIRTRREEVEQQAKDMLANAEVEARQIEADAHARLEDQIRRRGELAQQKIAQAELEAARDVKTAAAELAADVAAAILSDRVQTMGSDPAVDKAVAELPSKLQ
jgi:F-type H+-transporting ATPase subunit b